jgi:hypothetical protein
MSTGETIGYGLAHGLLLFTSTLLIGLFTSQVGVNFRPLTWVFLPIFGYCVSLGLLSAVNIGACGSVNLPLVARASIFTLGSVVAFLGISSLGFFQNFIMSALPFNLQQSFGVIFATAFYMFWAGLYGGAFGTGFASSCPSSS